VFAFECGIVFEPAGEIPAIAKVVGGRTVTDFIADFPLFGFHIIPGGIFEVKDFQVLRLFAPFQGF